MAKLKTYLVSSILAAGLVTAAAGTYSQAQINNEVETPISYSSKADTLPEIVIWSPWTAKGTQDTALQNIVDDWNANQAETYHFKVRVERIDTGYSGLTSRVESDVKAGDAGLNDLPNIYINYADTTSVLLEAGEKNYALDLTDASKVGAENVLDTDLFVEGSLTDSSLLAGAEEGAIYSIPMAMSSELMGINVPLFTWMLQGYQEAGGTVNISGEIATGIAGKLGGSSASDILTAEISEADRGTIETNWKIEGTTSGTLTITDDTFESAKAMTAMSKELLTVVKDTNKELSKDSSQGVIGIDASANEFYTYGQQITQSFTNPENGLLSIDDEGNVSYNMIEADTEAQEAAKEIWDFFIDGFESGALWNPNGSYMYGSNQFNAHKLVFSIGSTAGATYYYNTSNAATVNPEDIYYTQAPGKFEEDSTDAPVRMKQGPSFGAVDKGTTEDAYTAIFMNWLINGEISTIVNEVTTYITLENIDTYVEDIFGVGATVEVDGTIAADGATDGEYTNVKTTIGGEVYNSGDEIKTVDGKSVTWGVYSGKPELYEYNADNADGFNGGAYFNGLHTGYAYKHVITSESYTETTPADYMSATSGYLVGTKEVLSSGSAFSDAIANGQDTTNESGITEFKSPGTIGAWIAYENFTDSTVELEQEPYGVNTSAFRSEITSEVAEAHDTVNKGNEPKTADEFITTLHDEAVREGWMDGELWGNDGMAWWQITLIVLASLTVIGLIAFLVYWFVFKEKNTL